MKKPVIVGTLLALALTSCAVKENMDYTPYTPIDEVVYEPTTTTVETLEVVKPYKEVKPAVIPEPIEETIVETVDESIEYYFELSENERTVVECLVMGEAGGESYDGKVLVAQCILNACLKDGIQPSEVRTSYKYAGWNSNPSDEVIEAVKQVFDDGVFVTDEPILYFYSPKYCTSSFHESQRYVLTEGGHKFFAEWN